MDGAAVPTDVASTERQRRKRRLPKILSSAEAESILRQAENGSAEGTRNRLMLELMYRAGLRVSEIVSLAPRDVDTDGVIRLYDAKGGDGTAYFDPRRLKSRIERWLVLRESWGVGTGSPLFCKRDGSALSVRYVQRLVRRLKNETGIQGVCTPHVFRHTFATELIGEGFTLPEVQTALRHANLATTAIYLHVRDESLRRKVARRGILKGEE